MDGRPTNRKRRAELIETVGMDRTQKNNLPKTPLPAAPAGNGSAIARSLGQTIRDCCSPTNRPGNLDTVTAAGDFRLFEKLREATRMT